MEKSSYDFLSNIELNKYDWTCYLVFGKTGDLEQSTFYRYVVNDIEELVESNIASIISLIERSGGVDNFIPYELNNPKNQFDYIELDNDIIDLSYKKYINGISIAHPGPASEQSCYAYVLTAHDKSTSINEPPVLSMITVKNPASYCRKKIWALSGNVFTRIRTDVMAFSLIPDCVLVDGRCSIINEKAKDFWDLEKFAISLFKTNVTKLYDIACLEDISQNELYSKLNNRNFYALVGGLVDDNIAEIKDLRGEALLNWLFPLNFPLNERGNIVLSSAADYKNFLGKLNNDVYQIRDSIYRARSKERVTPRIL